MNNLTEQEKKFADAFVYLFFHAPALMPGMKEDAAVYAGYDVPVDRNAADTLQGHYLKRQTSNSTLIQKLKDSGESCLTIRA